MQVRVGICLFLLSCTPLLLFAAPRKATEADRAAIEAAGLTFKPGMLWDPASKDVGMSPADARTYLKSLPRGWAGSSAKDCKTYEDKNIDKLNSEFAVCAARFLKAYSAQHGVVTLTSAYRDIQESKCVCIGEPGACGYLPVDKNGQPIGGRGVGHQHGTAIDVWPFTPSDVKKYSNDRSAPINAQVQKIHDFARANPQFGVHFPFGMRDRPHMEPTGRGCGTGATERPVNTSQSPSQTLRNLFSGSTQPQNQSPSLLGSPTSPTPTSPASGTGAALPSTQSPTQQFAPPPQYVSPPVTAPSTPTSDNLLQILAPSQPTSTAKKTISINASHSDTRFLSPATSTGDTVEIRPLPSPVQVPTTFTPQATQNPSLPSGTTLSDLLLRLRAVIERMSQLLTPFGSRSFIAP